MTLAVGTTLYERLGGAPAIHAVVEDFYRRLLDDPDLKGFFDGIDMEHQKRQQVKFLTAAFGGPNEYQGRSMHDAHRHLGITEFHFDRVAEHLVQTLRDAGVGQAEIDEIVALVGPLKKEVVCC